MLYPEMVRGLSEVLVEELDGADFEGSVSCTSRTVRGYIINVSTQFLGGSCQQVPTRMKELRVRTPLAFLFRSRTNHNSKTIKSKRDGRETEKCCNRERSAMNLPGSTICKRFRSTAKISSLYLSCERLEGASEIRRVQRFQDAVSRACPVYISRYARLL